MRTKFAILISALVVFVATGCSSIVNKMAFHPDRVSHIPKERLPLGVEEKFFDTEDGIRIQSYFLADNSSEMLAIFFHGNAGNISHRLLDLLQLRQFGLNVLGVGYRGYGKSEGKPSEKGIYLDGEAALKFAISELGFDEENIIVFGRSIGTTVAINTSQERDIAGLILVSPLTSGKDQAKATGLGLVSFLAGSSFNNIDKVENITCPTLVIHGTDDRVIPYRMGVNIYNEIQSKKTMVTIDGAGHNNISTEFQQEYWEAVSSFVKMEKMNANNPDADDRYAED